LAAQRTPQKGKGEFWEWTQNFTPKFNCWIYLQTPPWEMSTLAVKTKGETLWFTQFFPEWIERELTCPP